MFFPRSGQALSLRVPDLTDAVRGRLVLVDGTDVPTGNRAGHAHTFAGRRRRAGLTIQVAADTEGVSTPLGGSMSDRKAFTESTATNN